MNKRVMHRPMFRKGGSANEGITSGLAPRQGYANKGFVEQVMPTKEEIRIMVEQELEEVYSEKQRRWACAQSGESRKDFKGKPSLSPKEAEEMCKDTKLTKAKKK